MHSTDPFLFDTQLAHKVEFFWQFAYNPKWDKWHAKLALTNSAFQKWRRYFIKTCWPKAQNYISTPLSSNYLIPRLPSMWGSSDKSFWIQSHIYLRMIWTNKFNFGNKREFLPPTYKCLDLGQTNHLSTTLNSSFWLTSGCYQLTVRQSKIVSV